MLSSYWSPSEKAGAVKPTVAVSADATIRRENFNNDMTNILPFDCLVEADHARY